MVLIIPITLTSEQQGYYFTFASLLGLQIFFELGLNQVITQVTSKEMALYTSSASGEGDKHLLRMRSALWMLRGWYGLAAILFFATTILAGGFLFKSDDSLPTIDWLGPWLVLVFFTAINLYYSPRLAVTEGCGHVGQVSQLRLRQSILGFLLTWIFLFAGAELWAIPVNSIVASIFTGYWLNSKNHVLRQFGDIAQISPNHKIDWRREVLPFQWRIAVSWMSGFLMYQLFTPLIFIHLGATMAGKLGLTLAIFTAIQSLGVAWFNTGIPNIVKLISKGDRVELNRFFKATFVRAILLTAVGTITVIIAATVVYQLDLPQAERLVDMPTLLVIAIGCIGNTAIYGAATYMRAHGNEPMLAVSVTAALLTLTAVYFASKYGAFQTMLAQTIITLLVVFPWTARIFNSYYSRR